MVRAVLRLPGGHKARLTGHALQRWCDYTPCLTYSDAYRQIATLANLTGVVLHEPPVWLVARPAGFKHAPMFLLIGDYALPMLQHDDDPQLSTIVTVIARGGLTPDERRARNEQRARRRARTRVAARKRVHRYQVDTDGRRPRRHGRQAGYSPEL